MRAIESNQILSTNRSIFSLYCRWMKLECACALMKVPWLVINAGQFTWFISVSICILPIFDVEKVLDHPLDHVHRFRQPPCYGIQGVWKFNTIRIRAYPHVCIRAWTEHWHRHHTMHRERAFRKRKASHRLENEIFRTSAGSLHNFHTTLLKNKNVFHLTLKREKLCMGVFFFFFFFLPQRFCHFLRIPYTRIRFLLYYGNVCRYLLLVSNTIHDIRCRKKISTFSWLLCFVIWFEWFSSFMLSERLIKSIRPLKIISVLRTMLTFSGYT